MTSTFPNFDGSSPKTQRFSAPPEMGIDPSKRYNAKIATSKGDMVVALDPVLAPKTVNNFIFLALHHYYDGIFFHRIIPGFVVQGGDPEGSGRGGPGYRFEDELPPAGKYEIGTLAMANAGPDTNGSQFFIVSGKDGTMLPPAYSIFGKVVKGLEVLSAIESVGSRSGAPNEKVTINSVEIAVSDD
ncbi:MAG: peptidylprolyl isomerase [Actinobacteria bacterium]|jgi:cyclophilin family peptidyl-prolyl cis-trans isomerase|nr:peptidylprolyl isomerase [Actinomycetota bacterium]